MLKLSKIVILLSVGFILFAGYSQRAIQDSDILQVTDSNLEDYQKRWEDVATYIEGKASSFSNEFSFSDDVTIDSTLTVSGSTTSNYFILEEITTPTATDSYGSLYTQSDNLLYFQDGAGTEHKIPYEDEYYAEMYWDDNSTATTIETANTPIMIRLTTTGMLQGWTYNEGSTGAITAYADYSGTVAGTVLVTSTAHGLESGDDVSIRGTTNYNGIFEVTVVDVDTFYITDTWVADDGASDWDEGDYLECSTNSDGIYDLGYNLSVSEGGGAGSYVIFRVYKNATAGTKCVSKRRFSNNDYGSISGGAIFEATAGDRIYLTAESTGINAITVQYGNIKIARD